MQLVTKVNKLSFLTSSTGTMTKKKKDDIYSFVCLYISGDHLYAMCGKRESSLCARVPQPNSAPFSVCIEAEKFRTLIERFPANDDITLTLKKNETLTLSVGRSNYTLETRSSDDYPIPEIAPEGCKTMNVNYGKFRSGLMSVAYAASNKSGKLPVIDGVNVKSENNNLMFTGLDGIRIARHGISCDGILDKGELNIPKDAVKEMISLGWDTATNVQLAFSANLLELRTPFCVYRTSLLNGDYPSVDRMENSRRDVSVMFDKYAFQPVLDRINAFSESEHTTLSMRFDGAQMELITTLSGKEQCREYFELLDCNVQNSEETHVNINPLLLKEAIASLDGEQIKLSCDPSTLMTPVKIETECANEMCFVSEKKNNG